MENYKDIRKPVTLLSPLGLSPGLLYSALKTITPHRLIVLTSKEGENSLPEIVQRAGYSGSVDIVHVDDPFNCFQQANTKVKDILNLLDNTPCVVNLTGGTTALQFIIQRAGAALESSGCSVEYVAFIDRRDIRVQKSNPWVVGEVVRVT